MQSSPLVSLILATLPLGLFLPSIIIIVTIVSVLSLKMWSYWTLVGFTIATAKKGLELETSNNFVVDDVTVENIGNQCVYLKLSSSYNVIKNSKIHGCGVAGASGKGVSLYLFHFLSYFYFVFTLKTCLITIDLHRNLRFTLLWC